MDRRRPAARRLAAWSCACALLFVLLPTISWGQVQTLELEMGGRTTAVDFHMPAGAPPRGAVVLAHGFTRSRATMAGHATALADAGALVVVPDMPFVTDSRANAAALAELIALLRAGRHAPPVPRIVLVGFSAGGLAALLAADAPGVVGYVGLDPFDRPGGVGRDKAATLDVPARLLRAPSSACNAFSIAEPWVKALRRLEEDRVLPSASHCDFEAPTDRLCRWACGDPDPQRQQAVRQFLLEAVRQWLALPAQAAAPAAMATAGR